MKDTHEHDLITEPSDNFEALKKAAHRTGSWRERLNAVNELGELGTDQAIHVLNHVLAGDSVYQVQEAAHRQLKKLGEVVQMPAKKQGELFKGVNKILVRIKKSLPEGHSFEEFKEKLRKTRLDIYDTYEGNKEAEFDSWLNEIWGASTRK